MAKKTKVVEIKSVPTEPQRGAGEGADPNDPVGIYYPFGGISRLIGSLAGGDEDEAVIKTGGCIVQHDINVRYRAPEAGWTETVNIEENNVQLTYNSERQVYVGILPTSAVINPVSGNQFIKYEVSGDISLSGKNISYDPGSGDITLVEEDNLTQGDLESFEVVVNESQGVAIIGDYQNAPANAPSINIKISTISEGTATNSESEPGSDDAGTDGK